MTAHPLLLYPYNNILRFNSYRKRKKRFADYMHLARYLVWELGLYPLSSC